MIGNIQLTGISYYFEFLHQLKVCYSKTENSNSADLFWVNVVKIGAKIQNNKKSPSIGYFLLCLVFSKVRENYQLCISLSEELLHVTDPFRDQATVKKMNERGSCNVRSRYLLGCFILVFGGKICGERRQSVRCIAFLIKMFSSSIS